MGRVRSWSRSGGRRSCSRRRKRRVRRTSRSGGRSPRNSPPRSRSPPPRSRSPPPRSRSRRTRSPSRYGAPMGGGRPPFGGRSSRSPSHWGGARRSRSRRPGGRRPRQQQQQQQRSPSCKGRRSRSNPADRRPKIEREKGGVKLFVGRLPREVHKQMLQECFEEFGDVLEVFVIASQAQSGVGCAFVRMCSLDGAEKAIQDLHEQRVLIPDQRDLGPMQVAFAKGEAIRLGIDEKEEILPSYREARQKVVEHHEKRQFFEAMSKQQEIQQQVIAHHQALQEQHRIMIQQLGTVQTSELVGLIKDGQRHGGPPFKQKWWSYCDQGWAGTRDYDPSHHAHEVLAQFLTVATYEYGHEPWFRKHFDDLPELPPLPPMPMGPPGPPGMPGPGPPFGPPGMMPPGAPPMMQPPPFGPPGMLMPGGPPMMPPPGPGHMPGFPPGPGPLPPLPPPGPGGPGFPFGPGEAGEADGRQRRFNEQRGGARREAEGSAGRAAAPQGGARKEGQPESDASSSGSGSEAGDIDIDDINADDI